MALQPVLGPWQLFQFLDLLHSPYDSLVGGSARHKAATFTQDSINTEWTQTPMPQMGFEPTILVFERTKTVLALYLAVTVLGKLRLTLPKYCI
jgi:hypothetical protein